MTGPDQSDHDQRSHVRQHLPEHHSERSLAGDDRCRDEVLASDRQCLRSEYSGRTGPAGDRQHQDDGADTGGEGCEDGDQRRAGGQQELVGGEGQRVVDAAAEETGCRPTSILIAVAARPTVNPTNSELREPHTVRSKTSCPLGVVPNGCCREGGCAPREVINAGFPGAMTGASSAVRRNTARMIRPMTAFRLRSRLRPDSTGVDSVAAYCSSIEAGAVGSSLWRRCFRSQCWPTAVLQWGR